MVDLVVIDHSNMLKSQQIKVLDSTLEVHITSEKDGYMLLRVVDSDCGEILITFNSFVSYEEWKSLSHMYFYSEDNRYFLDFLITNKFIYPTGNVKLILGRYYHEYRINKNKFYN